MQEKREHPRTLVSSHVTCLSGDQSFTGVAKDMSLGGMFIEADVVPAFGSKLEIQCRLPGMPQEATLPAIVRWVKPGGFGVQFGLLGARETHAITSILRERL